MRTKRTNGSTTYSYVYNGSQLSQMTVGSNTLSFAYDASGTPLSVTYNGTTYYYATNLQGDITAILNTSGTAVVTYTYDAWGHILSTSGSMANTLGTHNPLRYRGYVYDTETGLYYLQSRYYNPQVGRFLNADTFVSTGQGLLSNNMFTYCLNNPVMFKDVNGQSVTAAIAAGLKISADTLNAILLVCLVVVIVTNPQVQQWVETQRKIIEDKLVDVLTRAIPPKNEKYHIHHIVAQKDTRAEPARQILALVHIDVNSLVNKIPVKESVHRHLHTTAYFNWVNVQVMTAYWESEPNSWQQYENVVETLLYLQMQILAWNAISP